MVALAIIALLLWLLMPTVQQTRATAHRLKCLSNMRQIGIATQNYESIFRVFPGNYTDWTEELLPYLEQPAIYQRLKQWHSGKLSLQEVRSASVPVYVCPVDSFSVDYKGWSPSYRICDGYWPPTQKFNGFHRVHTGGPINGSPTFRQSCPADILDGLSNTIAFSEKLVAPSIAYLTGIGVAQDNPQVWNRVMRQTLVIYNDDQLEDFVTTCEFQPMPGMPYYSIRSNQLGTLSMSMYSHELGPNRNSCVNGEFDAQRWEAITATSLHTGGVNVCLADGSAKFIGDSIDLQVWRAISSRNGSEVVEF